jgi:hypothetical protein
MGNPMSANSQTISPRGAAHTVDGKQKQPTRVWLIAALVAAVFVALWAGVWRYKVYDAAQRVAALEGVWQFSHVRTPAGSQKVLGEWEGARLTFADDRCTLYRWPEVNEFAFTFARRDNSDALHLHDVSEQFGLSELLYAVEGDTLFLSYLLDGAVPETLNDGIVVVFKRELSN